MRGRVPIRQSAPCANGHGGHQAGASPAQIADRFGKAEALLPFVLGQSFQIGISVARIQAACLKQASQGAAGGFGSAFTL